MISYRPQSRKNARSTVQFRCMSRVVAGVKNSDCFSHVSRVMPPVTRSRFSSTNNKSQRSDKSTSVSLILVDLLPRTKCLRKITRIRGSTAQKASWAKVRDQSAEIPQTSWGFFHGVPSLYLNLRIGYCLADLMAHKPHSGNKNLTLPPSVIISTHLCRIREGLLLGNPRFATI